MINVRELKVQALQTAMKNPRLAKLVVSAAKSPLGSSIRTQAQHVVDSLYNTQLNHVQSTVMPTVMMQPQGGRGGAKNQPMPVVMQPPTPPEKVVLRPATLKPYSFQRPPAPRPVWSYQMGQLPAPQAQQSNGQGGDGQGGILSGLYEGFVKPKVDSIVKPIKDVGNAIGNAGKFVYNAVTSPSSLIGPAISGAVKLNNTVNNAKDAMANPSFSFPSVQTPGSIIQPRGPAATVTPDNPTFVGPVMPAGYGQQSSSNDSSFVGPVLPEQYGPPSPAQPGTFSSDGTYTPSGDPLVDYLMQSYQQGLGANSFALGAMADAKKLQSLLPGVPANKLPVGASLSGQLNDLQDALYKEYNIDGLYQTLNQAISSGQNLPEVATSYIRGKDEFLQSIDQMQKKATDAMLNNPMGADPFVQKSMAQYQNYLSVLKGRTTQRYIDYLNTATTYQNNQISALTQQYNTAADIVNRKYNAQAAITTEQYNEIKTALVDMYNNVAQRQQLQAESTKTQMETTKSYLDLVQSIADATHTAQQLDASSPLGAMTVYPKSSTTNKAYSKTDFENIDGIVGGYNDVLGALGSNSLSSYDTGTVFERYGKVRADKVKSEVGSTGSLSTLWNQDKNNLAQIAANADNLGVTNIKDLAQRYVDGMNSAYSNGVLQYLKDHKDKIYDLAKSMKNQASFDAWKTYNPWFKSAGWNVKNYLTGDNAISEDMARLLFNVVKAQQSTSGDIDEGSLPLEDIAGAIVGQLN